MKSIAHRLADSTAMNAFGVCSRIGEKMGISAGKVRAYFIYTSFATFGSPMVVYLALSFFLELRQLLRQGRSRIWDL
jgi:phage shock protein PspC (stress-responsive transcriptional regulator)